MLSILTVVGGFVFIISRLTLLLYFIIYNKKFFFFNYVFMDEKKFLQFKSQICDEILNMVQ